VRPLERRFLSFPSRRWPGRPFSVFAVPGFARCASASARSLFSGPRRNRCPRALPAVKRDRCSAGVQPSADASKLQSRGACWRPKLGVKKNLLKKMAYVFSTFCSMIRTTTFISPRRTTSLQAPYLFPGEDSSCTLGEQRLSRDEFNLLGTR